MIATVNVAYTNYNRHQLTPVARQFLAERIILYAATFFRFFR